MATVYIAKVKNPRKSLYQKDEVLYQTAAREVQDAAVRVGEMFAKLPKECVPEVEIATFMDEVERNNGTRTQLGKELYTINEVAEMFSMDRVTVYRMINRGELPYISLGEGRTRRIAREDIDAWVSKSRQYY